MRALEEILCMHKDELHKRFGVKKISIFGSYARGEADELSDVDILIELERPIGWEIVDLKEYLEEILGIRVDLITKNTALSRRRLWEQIRRDIVYVRRENA